MMSNPNVEDALNRIISYWEYEKEMEGYVSPKIQTVYREWPEFARAMERLVVFQKSHLSS